MNKVMMVAALALMPVVAHATDRGRTHGHRPTRPTVVQQRTTATDGAVAGAVSSSASNASATAGGGVGGSVTMTDRLQAPALGLGGAVPSAGCERVAGVGGSGPGGGGLLQFSWGVEWCRVLVEAQVIESLWGREAARRHVIAHNDRIRETMREPPVTASPIPAAAVAETMVDTRACTRQAGESTSDYLNRTQRSC